MCRLRPSLRDHTDPPGLREQVVVLLDEWARLSEDQPANQMHDKFVLKLQTAGFLKVLVCACMVYVLACVHTFPLLVVVAWLLSASRTS